MVLSPLVCLAEYIDLATQTCRDKVQRHLSFLIGIDVGVASQHQVSLLHLTLILIFTDVYLLIIAVIIPGYQT